MTEPRSPPSSSAQTSSSPLSILQFLLTCGKLKTTKRSGWVRHSVSLPESIADHQHRMGMMSLVLAGITGVDVNKTCKMSIVHDLAESIVGDITPHDGVSNEVKHQLEENAMRDIVKDLGTDGQTIYELWLEYERGTSPEAVLVKDFDKLEMLIQAFEYEESQKVILQEFYDSTIHRIKTTYAKDILQSLLLLRSTRHN